VVLKKLIFSRFFSCGLSKSRRTAKRPTVLNNWLPMLTIPTIFKTIYFLTNFRIFCRGGFIKNGKNNFPGLNANGLEIKQRAQRAMTLLVLMFIFFIASKKVNFYGEKWDSDVGKKYEIQISQKYDFSLKFFNCSLVKSRRTAIRPTVLNSLLPMLTIPITLSKIYFLTKFRIFCKTMHPFFLRKNRKVTFFRFECQWIGN